MKTTKSISYLLGAFMVCLLTLSICLAQDDVASTEQPTKHTIHDSIPLPLNDFLVSHFVRQGANREIEIASKIAGDGIVIKAKKELSKAFLDYLSVTYQITKVREVNKGCFLFSIHKKDITIGDVVELINHIYKDGQASEFVSSCSPVFLFDDGVAYATGRIIIQWKENITQKEAQAVIVDDCGFNIVEDLDKDTHVMVVEPTEKTGYNIFYLSHVLGPYNGRGSGLFVDSIEPEYETLTAPVLVKTSIQSADGKGYPGDINGSSFKYILKIYCESANQIKLKLDDLKITSDMLQKWLPKNKLTNEIVSEQAFKLESSSEPVTDTLYVNKKRKKIEKKVVTIEYVFRIYQSGTFVLSPPPVSYEIFDAQRGKLLGSDRIDGDSVEFVSASLLTEDASMVNDIAGVPDLKVPPLTTASSKKWQGLAYTSFAVAGLALIGIVCLLLNWARQQSWFENLKTIITATSDWLIKLINRLKLHKRVGSFSKQARKNWLKAEKSVIKFSEPIQFWEQFAETVRETLGLYVAGDKNHFKATDLSKITDAFTEILEDDQRLELCKILNDTETILYRNKEHACRDQQKFTKESAEYIIEKFSESLGFKKKRNRR